MAKKKIKLPRTPKEKKPSTPKRWVRPMFLCVLVLGLIAGAGFGLRWLEGRVLSGQVGAAPTELAVELTNVPFWMPCELADRIAISLMPAEANYYDAQLVNQVRGLAEASPWIQQVHCVEKYPLNPQQAVVRIVADFRMPLACVRVGSNRIYVDSEGVRLPSDEVPQWALSYTDEKGQNQIEYYLDDGADPRNSNASRVHYLVIDGVDCPPPAEGQRWEGEDLQDGLRLVKMIADRPYAYQITVVDVRNHDWRVSRSEPQLRMFAQVDQSTPTDIRFGRFPRSNGYYVVSPQRKLSYLDEYVEDHGGQLAGLNRYIDLRYDELRVSLN
jgi:hypothetical protein